MPVYKNTSGAVFTMPDGANIENSAEVEISADVLEVPGVAQFIAAGKMVEVEPDKPKRGRPAKDAE
jgi:hypothetical protein